MSNLRATVKSVLSQAGITPHTRSVIGVSGGADSLALLHLLANFVDRDCLCVGHLNHGLRSEAGEDADFVRRFSAARGLLFHTRTVDAASLAGNQSWSIEEAARSARYQFLADTAEVFQTIAVIVAHNADDQAETVLHHLLRGSGLRGLQGMRPVSPLPGRPALKLVRPLLTVPRAQIEAYCQENDLQPVQDKTNTDTVFLRNRIRHELLPNLATYNPQIKEHLVQLAGIVAADEALLAEQSDMTWQHIVSAKEVEWLRLDRAQWRALSLSMRRRTLRRALVELRPSLTDISFRTIDLAHQVAMDMETGAEATLPGNISLRLEYDHILIASSTEPQPINQPQISLGLPLTLPIPGTVALEGDWRLTAVESDLNLSTVRENRDSLTAFLDIGETDALQVRTRLPGERMQPLGMDGRSASVQDIMVNRKLPAHLRDQWPLVADAKHLLWLVGLHVDERAKVTEQTQRIIHISCNQAGGKQGS